jgi:hypothetical protein
VIVDHKKFHNCDLSVGPPAIILQSQDRSIPQLPPPPIEKSLCHKGIFLPCRSSGVFIGIHPADLPRAFVPPGCTRIFSRRDIMKRIFQAAALGLALAGGTYTADASVPLPVAEQTAGWPSLASVLKKIVPAVVSSIREIPGARLSTSAAISLASTPLSSELAVPIPAWDLPFR